MKPLAAPVIITSKKHYTQHQHYPGRWGWYEPQWKCTNCPSLFSERVKCWIESLLSLSAINPSISIISDITILWPVPQSPLSSDSAGATSHAPAPVKGGGSGSGVTRPLTQNQYQCQQEENCLCHWLAPDLFRPLLSGCPLKILLLFVETHINCLYQLFKHPMNKGTFQYFVWLLLLEALCDHWLK